MKYTIELTEREFELLRQAIAIHSDAVHSSITSPDKVTQSMRDLIDELTALDMLLQAYSLPSHHD